jgi:hypothetical protein
VAGLVRLFWLRFEAGDLYPPYSSLRSDPLGVQALYEGIQHLEGQETSRNFQPMDRFTPEPGATFIVCGLTDIPPVADEPWKTLLKKVTANGGRLVISLVSSSTVRKKEKEDVNDTGDGSRDPPEETPPDAPTQGTSAKRQSQGWRIRRCFLRRVPASVSCVVHILFFFLSYR